MLHNTTSWYDNQPTITNGWVDGRFARQYQNPGASYDIGNMFGLTHVDESQRVGVIYIRTVSGNIYALRPNGDMEDMRGSEKAQKVIAINLSKPTLADGKIIIGEPIGFEGQVDGKAVRGHTSRVTEFVVVESAMNNMIMQGINWRPELEGQSDFDTPAIFEASQQEVLARNK